MRAVQGKNGGENRCLNDLQTKRSRADARSKGARRLGDNRLGTEEVLLGLAAERSGLSDIFSIRLDLPHPLPL